MRLILVFFFLLHGCACNNGSRSVLRIGVDSNWYPLNFGPQTSYVNGFTDDVLIEMARYSGLVFEKIPANWDSLLNGLKDKKYDAILTSMDPYIFNTAKYDFSSNYLDLGPVLLLPIAAKPTSLSDMNGHLIGVITADPAALLLETHPTIIIRNFSTIPDLLNAVVNGDIQGALLDWIPAVNFTSDLFAGKLKISGSPMNDKGLHLVALKGQHYLVKVFNKNLDALKRKKTFDALLKKWQLTSLSVN